MAGRPASFDRNEKLYLAMRLFWQKGYTATSIQDLVDALNINRFSVYNTFGDKQSLFLAALAYYREQIFEPLLTPLRSEHSGQQRLNAYLHQFSDFLLRKKRQGCLFQSAGMEDLKLEDPSANKAIKDLLQYAFVESHALISRALIEGAMPEALAKRRATHIFSQLQGLIALNRMGLPGEQIQEQIHYLQEEVASWYSPNHSS